MGKKVVIFGATGYIGAYLTDYLQGVLSKEYEIVAVARKNLDYYDNSSVKTVKVDICSSYDFNDLPTADVYAVVDLAGVLPAYLKEFDPYIYAETNIMGGLRILEYARKVSADRIIYTQTWTEYAGYWGEEEILSTSLERKLVYHGDHAFYAISKSTMTEMMEFYRQEYGLKSFILVLPNVYMYAPATTYYVDGIERKVAYRFMIERAAKGENIELWGDPNAFKDILYIKDLCNLIYLTIISSGDGGKYNAGTGIKTTLRQQIQGIIDVFSPHPDMTEIIEIPEKPSGVNFVMDIENAREELGYEPHYPLIRFLEDYKIERELKRFDILFERK